jgi:NDP-sugar pyrophosphorylase family protein
MNEINVQRPEGTNVTKAMIFAAGLGTRLKPFTDHHPKALAVVNGKTLLQRNIEYLAGYGITNIIVNAHHFAEQISDFITHNRFPGLRVSLSYEKNQPLETGGGLKHASWFFQDERDPFIVMNADILTNLNIHNIVADHYEHQPLVTLAVTNRKSSRSFLFNEENILSGWRNNTTGEEKIARVDQPILIPASFSCVHVIEPGMLHLMEQRGKFSIIDTYLQLAKNYNIRGFWHNDDTVVDVGKPESIAEAEHFFD